MKKLVSLLLAIMMLATMALGTVTSAAAEAPATATAWLLYFASPGWWPQHQKMDQPSSETGVEATNAVITGPGKYTVGLKFNWQPAESALQFNLILDDAELAFPGYYVDITDIRVNGVSIPMTADNMYGTFHDDPDSGFAPIYNNYWNAVETPGSTGPDPATMRAYDGVMDTEHWEIIDPTLIVAGATIEVDFIVAAEAGAAPEELGEKPEADVALDAPVSVPGSSNAATVKLQYLAGNQWLHTDGSNAVSTEVTVTGEGTYTASANMVDLGGWNHGVVGNAVGVNKMYLVFDSPEGTVMDGMYVGVTAVRVDGVEYSLGNAGYGRTWYNDDYYSFFEPDDYYVVLYDQWQTDNGGTTSSMGLTTWNGETGTVSAVDPSIFTSSWTRVEVDFFVTATQGVQPGDTSTAVWSGKNTVGLAGLSLKDLGIADDWHNIVPVDVSQTGWHKYTLVGSDAHIIGNAFVSVNNGSVNVSFVYAGGPSANLIEYSQCIKWFTSLDEITPEALASTEGGLTSADVVSVADDLGGVDVAYLSINNKVAWCTPLRSDGSTLPRYFRNTPTWLAWREQLMTLLPTE